jgi:hypothetical protein
VHLQAHVITAGVVTGVGDDRGGAVVEGDQRGGGGDNTELGEEDGAVRGADGIQLDRLAAG